MVVRFEFLELAEEVLDQVTPLIHLSINDERLKPPRMP